MRNHIRFPLIFLSVLIWLVGCQEQPISEETPFPTAMIEPTPTLEPTATLPAYEPVFETADCQFHFPNANEIRCGYLVVPEDRSHPERLIRLHVAVVSSAAPSPAPDPFVYLNGGPGGHTLDQTANFVPAFSQVLRNRDLIFFDQRGIGYSEPSLNCPELEEARLEYIEQRLDVNEEYQIRLDSMRACQERLIQSGINLSAYNSAESAADLNDLRQVLGYDIWNIYGVSYGSRLALTAMRDYGETGTIRSVVLDSVYPPQINAYAELGPNADHAFNLLFERCAAIESCAEDYPNLKARFYQLVDEMNNDPIIVILSNARTQQSYQVPIDGDDLVNIFFSMMYYESQIIRLPKMIRQLEGGTSTILTNFLRTDFYRPYSMSEGMNFSVQCFEEAPFNSPAVIEAANQTAPPHLAAVFGMDALQAVELCGIWQPETAGPEETEPVMSDIPTLVLAGDYDPITPPRYGTDTAAYLSQVYYFEFEGLGHGIASSHNCGMNIMVDFLERPDQSPDGGCLDSLFIGFTPP